MPVPCCAVLVPCRAVPCRAGAVPVPCQCRAGAVSCRAGVTDMAMKACSVVWAAVAAALLLLPCNAQLGKVDTAPFYSVVEEVSHQRSMLPIFDFRYAVIVCVCVCVCVFFFFTEKGSRDWFSSLPGHARTRLQLFVLSRKLYAERRPADDTTSSL